MNSKTCTKCGELKTIDNFYKARKEKDGLSPWCKSCCKEYNKEYNKKNHDRISKNSRKYYLKNQKKVKNYSKKYYKSEKGKEVSKKSGYKYRQTEKFKKYIRDKNQDEEYHFKCKCRGIGSKYNKIKPKVCSCCKVKKRVERHHDEYSLAKAREIRWLCLECHRDWHSKNKVIINTEPNTGQLEIYLW